MRVYRYRCAPRAIPAPTAPSPGTPGEGRGEGLRPVPNLVRPQSQICDFKSQIPSSPSPGTPGEGWGEGLSAVDGSLRRSKTSHPNPSPRSTGARGYGLLVFVATLFVAGSALAQPAPLESVPETTVIGEANPYPGNPAGGTS